MLAMRSLAVFPWDRACGRFPRDLVTEGALADPRWPDDDGVMLLLCGENAQGLDDLVVATHEWRPLVLGIELGDIVQQVAELLRWEAVVLPGEVWPR